MDCEAPLAACLPDADSGPDALLDGFLRYAAKIGLTLYPHQEEAILAIFEGNNVIVHTPTGSGKSLIAAAVHFTAAAEGKRSFYTSPVKALVSEKFFALCRDFGPERVGMMTGDATVNRDAPIVCCTAEVLANIALAEGENASVDFVVMDEFHFFSDPDRGVAWQVPLLTLPQARFVLMSATLGDVSVFERALEERTGAEVVTVRSVERPVPLNFEYAELLFHEAIQELVGHGRAPVYVVSFTQRGAAEIAQGLLSTDFCTKEEKRRIAEALVGESFRSPHGKEMQRLVRHGIGLHHAGLLPRYRLLVEKLAQRGLLKIICGTDTLGVGVNIPIRTVLLTRLCKYDGAKVRILSARDFHQIAGRAGRKGFDDQGYVIALAPEHVVENQRLESKALASGKKRKQAKKPPEWGYAHWDRSTFERLVHSAPEPLVSRFEVSPGMLLAVLGRESGGCSAMKRLIRESFESAAQKKRHKARALSILRSLWQAGVVEFRGPGEGGGMRVNAELQRDFSLFHTLGLYVVDAVERLDPESPSYALDVVSLVESILEDPEVVLRAQVDKLKTEKLAELKAAGVEYDERMIELEKIEHPKPNAEFAYESFALFEKDHPWLSRESLRPKSVARELLEEFYSFSGYVKRYGLSRSEGLLLRYLSDVYKTLVQTVPEGARTEELDDRIAQLGTLVRGVDSSLLDEWERLLEVPRPEAVSEHVREPEGEDVTRDTRRFTALVRNQTFSLLRALASGDYEAAFDLVDETSLTSAELARGLRPLFEEGHQIQLDQKARSPEALSIERDDETWRVVQSIVIDDEISEYAVTGRVDIARSRAARRPFFVLDAVGSIAPGGHAPMA